MAVLERQAQDALAKLQRAKAARLGASGGPGALNSGSSSGSFSGWEATPAEVQRRATATTSHVTHSHNGHDASSYTINNDYGNGISNSNRNNLAEQKQGGYESYRGGQGGGTGTATGMDYNQNVDYCNVPQSSVLDAQAAGSSYDMRGGGAYEDGGGDAPLCACGLVCVSLTSRTAANMDRVFFKCAQHKDSGVQCDFFEVRREGEKERRIRKGDCPYI